MEPNAQPAGSDFHNGLADFLDAYHPPASNMDRIDRQRIRRGLTELPDAGVSPGVKDAFEERGMPQPYDVRSTVTPGAELRGTGPGESRDPFKAAGYYDTPEQRSAKGAADAAGTVIADQGRRVGDFMDAAHDAYKDPSLANVTNAGVRAGLMIPTAAGARVAIGAGGAGMGFAMTRDLPAVVGGANAAPKGAQAPAAFDDLPYLSADENKSYKSAAQRLSRPPSPDIPKAQRDSDAADVNAWKTENIRRGREQSEVAQHQYQDRVDLAKRGRDEALGRDYRFGDTEMGKLYDKLGPTAASEILAGISGGLTRLAHGAGGTPMQRFGVPAAMGAAGFATGEFAPDIANAVRAPSYNPQKEGYQAYARDLPDGHPDKVPYGNFANSLPAENPVKSEAWNSIKDNLAPRLGLSLLLGGASGVAGRESVDAASRVPGRIVSKIGELPGQIQEGYWRGQEQANAARAAARTAANPSHYADYDESHRDAIKRFIKTGAPTPPGGFQEVLEQAGLPPVRPSELASREDNAFRAVSAKRIDYQNKNHGAPPTPEQWREIDKAGFDRGIKTGPLAKFVLPAGVVLGTLNAEPEDDEPKHHSNYQPRTDGGQFNGAPQWPGRDQ